MFNTNKSLQLVLLLLSVLFAFATHVDERLPFDGGTMTYQSGSVDPNTLNGEAFDVAIRFDDGGQITAKRYLLRTSLKGEELSIDQFRMEEIDIEDAAIPDIAAQALGFSV